MEQRAVRWIPPVLYTVVLAGGFYHAAVAAGEFGGARLTVFAAGLLALLALEAPGPDLAPAARLPAEPLLVARVVLFVVVAVVDGSGVSRALFVLVPFTAYLAFGRWAALACAAGCVGLLLVGLTVLAPGWWVRPVYVSDVLMFGLALALVLSVAGAAVREQETRVRLEESRERLARYAERVAELSAADERSRAAGEIHVSLGHRLTAVGVQLEKAEAFRALDQEVSARALADARRSVGRALEEVRASVGVLRGVRPFSLVRSLAELVRYLGDERLAVELTVTGEESGHDAGTLTTLYRAAQEAITNARRHGRATRVEVRLVLDGPAARLTVTDNGRGIARGSVPGHGIRGLRERVALLGGRVDIRGGADGADGVGEAGESGGVAVTVTVPRRSPAGAGAGAGAGVGGDVTTTATTAAAAATRADGATGRAAG
ncbi:sensor histidine kinase [Kitasatospora sp. NPDC004723]|uniref:sensor histidine kinase n=1 Tax=Kitasatospora sp. NPDC004723 TaxID=3154288 RepID=UPI0033B0D3D0